MSIKADNAVILAAGTASRFAPLSYETPKALLTVRGEVLIERQIRQLHEAGIDDVALVVGYQKEKFAYLPQKLGVRLIENPDYQCKNNPSSLWAARNELGSTYVCSSDNYFAENPFSSQVEESYYASVYMPGKTSEWCLSEDADGYIRGVTIGGNDAWVMLGHTFWSESFSRTFLRILEKEYHRPEVFTQLWERLYMSHLDELPMKAKHYPDGVIYEFDTFQDLLCFDPSYQTDPHSAILEKITKQLCCSVDALSGFSSIYQNGNEAIGCTFSYKGGKYRCRYGEEHLERVF